MARADQAGYTLLSNGSATGASTKILGGLYVFSAEGTVGGATISLQYQTPNGTWVTVGAVGGTTLIQSTTLPYLATQIYLPPCNVRCAITGGSPTGIYAYINGVG